MLLLLFVISMCASLTPVGNIPVRLLLNSKQIQFLLLSQFVPFYATPFDIIISESCLLLRATVHSSILYSTVEETEEEEDCFLLLLFPS